MRSFSFLPPINFDHLADDLGERISFGCREVGFLVLGESSQSKDRQVLSTEYIDNSRTATLAPRAEAEPHLPNTATAGNDHAASGVSGQAIHDGQALFR